MATATPFSADAVERLMRKIQMEETLEILEYVLLKGREEEGAALTCGGSNGADDGTEAEGD